MEWNPLYGNGGRYRNLSIYDFFVVICVLICTPFFRIILMSMKLSDSVSSGSFPPDPMVNLFESLSYLSASFNKFGF